MASLFRALALALLVVSACASANYPAEWVWTEAVYSGQTWTTLPTADAVAAARCSKGAPCCVGAVTGTVTIAGVVTASCTIPDGRYVGYAQATINGPFCSNGGTATSSQYSANPVCQHSCPSGQFETSSGSCVPACPSGVAQKPDGSCNTSCIAGESVIFDIFAGFSVGKNKVISGGSVNPYSNPTGRCNADGCGIDVKSISSCPAVVGTVDSPKPITCHGTGVKTGVSCTPTAETSLAAPVSPPDVPQKKPVCSPSEGVLTTSSGTVACISSGTPSQVPVIAKSTQVQTNPDGSTKTITTTYTKDPATQVQDTNQVVTTTGVGGSTGAGAVPGQAGVIGTTSTAGSASSSGGTGPGGTDESGKSNLCKDNPGLDVCENRLNKEETQEKIKDSLSTDGFDPASHITADMDASEAAKKVATDKVAEVVSGVENFGTAADPASSKYAQFQESMGSWWEPIPMSGCTPFSAKIGPWQWNFDICPTAAKISEIGAYCMWIMLLFGCFALVTKEGK